MTNFQFQAPGLMRYETGLVEKALVKSEVIFAWTFKEIQSWMGNKGLVWMFGNCFPKTLDAKVTRACKK